MMLKKHCFSGRILKKLFDFHEVWFPWDIVSRTRWLEIRGGPDLGWVFFPTGMIFSQIEQLWNKWIQRLYPISTGEVCKLKISIWLALSFVVNVGCIVLYFFFFLLSPAVVCFCVCCVAFIVIVYLYYWCTQRVFLGRKGKESLVTQKMWYEECTYKHHMR